MLIHGILARCCAGIKGEAEPCMLTGWEKWRGQDFNACSTSSSDASSLALPMQETWDDLIAQPQSSADATAMLWLPQADAQAEPSMAMSVAWLPGSATSSMASPFAASAVGNGSASDHFPASPGAAAML